MPPSWYSAPDRQLMQAARAVNDEQANIHCNRLVRARRIAAEAREALVEMVMGDERGKTGVMKIKGE